MALDTIQFVDSIASSPTVALDLNSSDFLTRLVSFTPGQVRYAMSDNAMTDGVFVSSSTVGAGQLVLELDCRTASQDTNATALQTLFRQLDKPTNLLKYQPNGLTKPVFFQTFRSSPTQINDIMVSAAMRVVTLTLMTQPYALGLREEISVGTVNNDPAHATNGCYFDVAAASCIGDVPAPVVIVDTVAAQQRGWVAKRHHGTPTDGVFFYQAESASGTAGVSNPGGGPDAAMSGAGTNNYLRSTGAGTATVRWDISGSDAEKLARVGDYRVLLTVRQSSAVEREIFAFTTIDGADSEFNFATSGATTNRQVVDIGIFNLGTLVYPGGVAQQAPVSTISLTVEISAVGAGTIDFDCIQFLPADESQAFWSALPTTSVDHYFDGPNEAIYTIETAGSLFSGTTNIHERGEYVGKLPDLVPNTVNRFFWIIIGGTPGYQITKGDTSSLTLSYWPRYTFIRPSAT